MNALFNTSVTVSLVVLCGIGAAAMLRSRSAALRHWILSAAVMCALAAPLLQVVAPSWHLPRMSPSAVTTLTTYRVPVAQGEPRGAVPEITATATSFNFAPAFVPLWLAGAAISLSVLFIAMTRLTWIASRSERVRDQRWVDLAEAAAREHRQQRTLVLLQSDHPTLLVTWGLMQPKIILPAVAREWSDDRIHVVLSHELAHIARWDWATQLLAELLRSIYWFNPLVWIACRRLRREGEHACDDTVLNLGVEGPDYATHLLDLARVLRHPKPMWSPAPAMARQSTLERRIRAMLNGHHNRQGITRIMRVATSIALLTMTLVIAGYGASAQTFSTISGAIVDSQGASLPDARLVLSNVETKATYEVRSNRTGQFEFLGITSGDYVLQAIAPGFKSFQANVSLSGQTLRRDISMNVGTLEETVSITGGGGERSAADRLKDEQFALNARERFQRTLAECRASDPIAGTAVGGQIRPPRKIRDVRPLYPEGARSAGIAGSAKLVAIIGTDGFVKDVKSVDATVNPDLVQAATEAVRQWEFDGTLLNCVPVEVEMTVSVGFSPER